MKRTQTREKIGPRGKRKDPIENHISLEDLISFERVSGTPGACLLSKKGKNLQFRFCFDVDSISPSLDGETMENVVEFISNGVKAFPDGETFQVIQNVKPNNRTRIEHYKKLARGAPSPLFREMVRSMASPGEYFTNLNQRDIAARSRSRYKEKSIRIWVTVSPDRLNTSDRSEKIVSAVAKGAKRLWENFTGEYSEVADDIKNIFRAAENGYDDWVNILSNQMLLSLRPLTVDEIAQELWDEFNVCDRPEVPQIVKWDGDNLTQSINDPLHISSWLFATNESVPRASRNFVYQRPVGGDEIFSGVVSMANKPGGWRDAKDMLLYLYNKADIHYDYKVVATFTRASTAYVEKNIELLQKQSNDALAMAARRNLPATRSEELKRDADAAVSDLYSGNAPIKMSLCFVVRAREYDELETVCKRLQSRFALPARFVREIDYSYQTWLQTYPQLSYDRPLFKPYDRTRVFLSSNIASFMPLVKVKNGDRKGLEFTVKDEGCPYYLDVEGILRHILFLAITRAGKSVLFAKILLIAMCSDMPMVVIDYPREDGDSTFGPITHLAGKDGAYLNIANECNNFLELPDLSNTPKEEREDRLRAVFDYSLDILMIIMFGSGQSELDREKRVGAMLLGNLLNKFYADPAIVRRFELASKDDVGGDDWKNAPTLEDLCALCTKETLIELVDDASDEHIQFMNEIRLRFMAFMQTSLGRSMSRPTTIPRDAKLLVFAFKGIKNNDEAGILMASATAAAMRRTLHSPKSILFMDECSILSKFPALMAQAARIADNGAKSGISLMMALQTPASLGSSKYGSDLLANMATRIIGRVDPADVKNYCDVLDIPAKLLSQNTTDAFKPNKAELYSNWLIVQGNNRVLTRCYAPPLLLAAVANNPAEEAAKKAFLECYEDDVEGLKAFAKELIAAAQDRRALVYPQVEKVAKLVEVSTNVA